MRTGFTLLSESEFDKFSIFYRLSVFYDMNEHFFEAKRLFQRNLYHFVNKELIDTKECQTREAFISSITLRPCITLRLFWRKSKSSR